MSAVATIVDKWSDTKRLHVIGTIALSGSYATGGMSLDFNAMTSSVPGSPALPGISKQPILARVEGIAGYIYQYDKVNKKLIIRQSGTVTPAGTISAPTITTTTNAGTTAPLYTNGGALTQVAGATGITGVQAPTFTGAATTAAPLAELPASSLPAGVTGDTITFELIYKGI